MKHFIKNIASIFGFTISKTVDPFAEAIELSTKEKSLIQSIKDMNLTMTSINSLIATFKACKYVIENNINGDFVECGVWRGGHAILASKVFEMYRIDKKVYLFDTFAGMTEPTNYDINANSKKIAINQFNDSQMDNYNSWCYASIEDVKNNFLTSGLALDYKKVFIKGDVSQTLTHVDNLPQNISILRLDTDWYESTKDSLNILYPLLLRKGVLLLDDSGHWEGARKAVDEYFLDCESKPLLGIVDYTGRIAIKI